MVPSVVHFTLTGKVVTVGKLHFTLPWYGIYLEVCFSEKDLVAFWGTGAWAWPGWEVVGWEAEAVP